MSFSGLQTKTRSDAVELRGLFSTLMSKLLLNEDYSGVTFIVDNQRLPAQRAILETRSEHFRSLLYGSLLETAQKDIYLNAPVEAFKTILSYIYSVHLSLSRIDERIVLGNLCVANQSERVREVPFQFKNKWKHYIWADC